MAVTESYKGRGIGRMLMETAISYAKSIGMGKIIIFTNTGLIPAINLYRSCGFIEIPLEDNKYIESDMKMEKEL